MKILAPLKPQVTACGTYRVGRIEVAGQEFRIETDRNRTWLSIIDEQGRQESCVIDADADVISESGEHVTTDWTDSDWSDLTKFAA